MNNHSALTFTLSDGKTVITVPANGTTGSITVTAPDNVYVGTNPAVLTPSRPLQALTSVSSRS
ncbi:hypothetical protein [Pseudomonas monteilii]|uniref:hypothetical protein n=1 Tax=Pseudomonas monteilii TaxID=76759 RepID=UPI0030840B56